jgi:chromosome segregation ATPase
MSRRQVERRLRDVSGQLRALRDDLRITEEQLVQLTDEADDARIRALVSETPLAEREHRQAGRHAEALRKHRDDVVARISALEADQDALLDRLNLS